MANGESEVGADVPAGGFVQLLTPDGERVDSVTTPDGVTYSVDFTDDEYRELYRDLVTVRRLDTEATALQRQGELGIWASLLGQEAAQVGSGRALRPQDMAFPTYREHGVLYCRGIDPIMPFGLFRGVDQGGWDPNEYKFNTYTIVIGSQTLHATGYAMGITMDGKTGGPDGEAVIAYFGDGATSQGEVNEGFVWSGVFHAPIVFFCQNNQWAISEPTSRQSKVTIAERGKGHGIPSIRVDGNDVIASYAVANWAMQYARSGGGPVFVEAFTYRMGAHTTSDDPSKYRSKADEAYWAERDPISRLATYLESIGELPAEFVAEVEAEGKELARRTREEVRSWEPGPSVGFFDHAYAAPHATVEAERAWYERFEGSFVEAH